jgi:fructose-bisphosphate aldolase class II
MRAVIEAAEEENAPVIVEIGERELRKIGIPFFAVLAKERAIKSKVPVVVHLDHGRSPEFIGECLKAGFSSVMFDGSARPIEENIQMTKEIVGMAGKYGASVEAEVGRVPGIEGSVATTVSSNAENIVLTDPEEASRLVEETKVDALAVSIGTAHYMRRKPFTLDFELLKELSCSINVPLVLHGGAAVTDEDMRHCVELGICKYNIAFKVYKALISGIDSALSEMIEEVAPGRLVVSPASIIDRGLACARDEIRQKIRILGSAGKA